ncbi:hypothetical protein DHD32_17060 [Arenibacter sp. TNZ]|jgi:hypothetical protein|uniref:hypothetical protein n=1 Tax=Arenibacter TaxID=178469 RepID=UPI000CD49116|nr:MULTISPECIES: hypothetical protein [Arenibacter]MCM4173189.1 hypothetical protein [Arenibacter sp. TNZ]
MQKQIHIKALFFLGIFSFMMLHQAFPHLHHQHEETHSHSDIAHKGEHHHNDDHSQEDENSPLGFFGFFLDMHVHSTVSSEIGLFNRDIVEKQTIIGKEIANGVFDIQGLFLIDDGQNRASPIYHPPNTYFNSYLSSLDTRGPPSLG